MVADGDYTNHASVQAAAVSSGGFIWFLVDSWKPGNMTPMAAMEPYQSRVPTMLSTMSTSVPLANDSLSMW